MFSPHRRRRRRGYSLLDTLAAGTVLAIALVPAYSAMRQGLEWSRDAATVQNTPTFCVATMEEHLAIAAATFANSTETGDFSADGHALYKYSVTRSDNAGSGGIADRLMAITVTVWKDDDNDNALDSGEISTTLKTHVAKIATYVDGI